MKFKYSEEWIKRKHFLGKIFFGGLLFLVSPFAIYDLYLDDYNITATFILVTVIFSIFWLPYAYEAADRELKSRELVLNDEGVIFRNKKGENIVLYKDIKEIRVKGKGPDIIELKYRLLDSTFPCRIEGKEKMENIVAILTEKSPDAKVGKIKWWDDYI